MRPARYAGALLALGCLAVSLLLTVATWSGGVSRPVVVATAFGPFALVGYLVALVLTLLARPVLARWLGGALLVVALAGAGAQAARLVPSYTRTPAGSGTPFTALELNTFEGRADPAAIASLVGRTDPGVLVLSEMRDPLWQQLLAQHTVGPGSRLPYVAGTPGYAVLGTVVASRWPLTDVRHLDVRNSGYVMRVGGPTPFTLVAAHTSQELISLAAWRHDFAVLQRTVVAIRGPRLLVGDLNATLDHGPLRELLTHGLRDAAEEAGSGWQPTWPHPGVVHVGPVAAPIGLFAIDHVLVGQGFSAVDTRTIDVKGSDHRALLAHLLLRR